MNLGESFNQPRTEITQSVHEIEQFDQFRGVTLPPAYINADSSEIKLVIEERIKNIAAMTTTRSSDSFAILEGRPEDLGKKSSAEIDSHKKNEFFLVDLNAPVTEESTGSPAILHVELVSEDGRVTPIVRPYGGNLGQPSLESVKICAAIYQEFGLSIESQKALINRYQASISPTEAPSSLTPFRWTSGDLLLGVLSHLATSPLIYCAIQAGLSSEGQGGGWIMGCFVSVAIAAAAIYGFWNRIYYLKRRPHVASLVEHLSLTEDRKALRSAVQGSIDHEMFNLLERYVTDKKSVADSVALAHAVAKIGIAEISNPRKIEYWSYDSDSRRNKLYWDIIDKTTVFGWLSKIGGSNPDARVQAAVQQARAKLEEFLGGR